MSTQGSESEHLDERRFERLTTGAVVVGIDGSEFAGDVAAFGLREAGRRGAPVVMLTAYTDPIYWGVPGPLPVTATDVEQDALAEARRVVDAAVEAVGDVGFGEVHVAAEQGPPADVLIAASRHAGILVVGHRGRGGVSSRLIGSVGLSCVIHAHCTLTVVRPVHGS